MKQFIALIKREWLEHSAAFIWTPVVTLVVMMLVSVTLSPSEFSFVSNTGDQEQRIEISADDADAPSILGLLFDVAGSTDAEIENRMEAILKYVATPFYWVLFVISLFAALACLYDERANRSVLFWKSMPVSDIDTVLSKYVFVVWVAPLATFVCILVAQVFAVGYVAMAVEDGFGSRIWSNSTLITTVLQTVLGFALNGLVMLPIYGWFMLVSGWATSVPFIWALGVPFWLAIVDGFVLDSGVVSKLVSYHASMPTLPTADAEGNIANFQINTTQYADQFGIFADGQFWFGLIVGGAFLAGAVYFRARRNEI